MDDREDARPAGEAALPVDYFHTPSPARFWNYLQGGRDNYPLDQAVAEAHARSVPEIFQVAQQSRRFQARAVRFLAHSGVSQFLDIGCGLPVPAVLCNTHEVAQGARSDARVMYVDNDKVVLAHTRALLTPRTPDGRCAYLDADARNPDSILYSAAQTLDFTAPVAVILAGVLGHIATYDQARSVVTRLMSATAVGSHLVLVDGVDVGSAVRAGVRTRNNTGIAPYHLRTLDQLHGYFDGLHLLEPGIVPITRWRPTLPEVGSSPSVHSHCGVAIKPDRGRIYGHTA